VHQVHAAGAVCRVIADQNGAGVDNAALGNAYAAVGQVDKAVSKLKDAASKADSKANNGTNNSLSPTFLLQAGELLESQGKTDEALKVYQDIKKKYVNSVLVQSNEIDKYIERTTK